MGFEGDSTQPEIASVLGVPVVTIPLADYADYLDCKRQLAHAYANGAMFADGQISLFLRDPEVATFVVTRFGLMTAREIVSEARLIFGEDRAPLISTVIRFWTQVRPCLPHHARDNAI